MLYVFGMQSKEAEAATSAVCDENTEVCNFLSEKYDAGLAAGNVGDYYQNADGGHSGLDDSHPQVTELPGTFGVVMTYDPTKVIVGNASIAVLESPTAPNESSRNRYDMMGNAFGASIAYLQYTNNNAYWYPAHVDYGENGKTDDFHAMWPLVSSSEGSSWREGDEVSKFFYTLAAFRPDVKDKLRTEGLLMPTIQMIMRRTRVSSDNEYLNSVAAHSNAFVDYYNELSMAQMANAITIDKIPPFAKLRLVSDTYGGIRGQDYFDTIDVHPHFQTPASIAFVWRNFNYTQKIRVSAADSYDVNGHPLTYTWSVIRGEPSRVRITPLNDQKTEVDIEIDYHAPRQIVPEEPRVSSLVVIGLFAHNGFYYSAPAYVTSYTQPNETRTYDPESKNLTEIQYQTNRNMILPVSINKAWEKDTFDYASEGVLDGWHRERAGTSYGFTNEGYQIISTLPDETPKYVQNVSYYQKLSEDMYLLDWDVIDSPDFICSIT